MAAVVTWVAVGEGPLQVVLCGSPRANGRSARLAQSLADDLAQRDGSSSVALVSVAAATIQGCIGCDRCRFDGQCAFCDDMATVLTLLDRASQLHVVSPVYFAGPPSQFKALLDRLQPHFWKNTRYQPKRPARLQVVGEGGDPYGYGPLVTVCRSALSVAGFELVDVEAHIGADPDDGGEANG